MPSRRITYDSHAHDIAYARHWAPRLTAVMREAGAHHAQWITSPGLPETGGEPPKAGGPEPPKVA